MQKLDFPNKDKTAETEMLSKGADKLRSHVESARNREAEAETCYGQRLLREAVPLLVDGIEDWFKQQRKSPNPSNAYHELLQLSPKVVSFIALKSIVDTLTIPSGVTLCIDDGLAAFNSRRLSLKLTNTGSSPELYVIIK